MTGGIAHDFNNLLTIVVANLDRIRRLTEDDPRLDRPVVNAIAGAERAAALTKQLLAFARRQPLVAVECDLNAAVIDVRALAGAAIGGMTVTLNLSPHLWRVNVDINQIENALLNLVVNARDAMPGGGTLTVTTANVTDAVGDCVEVAVTDTGTGMAADVVAHAFEPFFTTKELGHGTGLGLSQVYGFVTQSGGTVAIESEIGRGTTIRIRLPRA